MILDKKVILTKILLFFFWSHPIALLHQVVNDQYFSRYLVPSIILIADIQEDTGKAFNEYDCSERCLTIVEESI